jgi:DNA polymerase-3 subunit gamma/tau
VLREEKIDFTPEALAMLARAADGSMRDALSLTDQVISLGEGHVTGERVRTALGLVAEDEYLRVLDMIAARRAGDVFATVRKLADAGVDFGVFLAGLADILRAQLALLLGGSVEGVSPEATRALESHRDKFAAGDLLRMLSTLAELEPLFRKSAQQQLLVEMLLVRFALFDRAIAIEDLLRGLSGAGNGGNDSGGRSVRTPERREPRAAPIERETRRGASLADGPAIESSPPPPAGSQPEAGAWKAGYEQTSKDAARSRLTPESVRAERLASLRAKDPVLDAAIDELDLELLD